MANLDQLADVARHCDEYHRESYGFENYSGTYDLSCETCKNYKGHKCEAGVFDSVLSSLDQG